MKIGVLSDIHCNVRGLLRGLEGMGQVEEVRICAFDDPDQSRGAIREPQGPLVRDASVPEP